MKRSPSTAKNIELALRFRREYKPYSVKLKDVVRIDYSGTDTPRDYSSVIEITDKQSGETQEGRTWMNNPIRYRGETFYQSQYQKAQTPGGGHSRNHWSASCRKRGLGDPLRHLHDGACRYARALRRHFLHLSQVVTNAERFQLVDQQAFATVLSRCLECCLPLSGSGWLL